MKTLLLSGGDLGRETMMVRCNLTEASSPVEVDYMADDTGWQPTQYQCADARHTASGLVAIAKKLAAGACEMPEDEFDCECDEN